MIGLFKKLIEQALDLKLTVRFTRQDGEWFVALDDMLDSLSLKELCVQTGKETIYHENI